MYKITLWQQIRTQVALVLIGLWVVVPIWALFNVALDASIKGSAPSTFHLFPAQFSLDAFRTAIVNPSQSLTLWGLFKNSMVVSIGSAITGVVFGMSAAYAFARYRFPGRQVGLFALLLGTLLPPVALMMPLYLLLTIIGLRTTLIGLMIAYTAFAMPFCVWNMRAAFQSVSPEMEEAATLDGASPFRVFLQITLPLALPSVAIAGLIAFLASYTEFAIGWMFVESSKTVTLAMAISVLVGPSGRSWRAAAALYILMSIPVVIVTLVLRRYFLQGVLLGTVAEE
jgi:arabinogalactan oligomer/maltooligosaccharide transport system permease protein